MPLVEEVEGVAVGVLVDAEGVLEGDDWAGCWFGVV